MLLLSRLGSTPQTRLHELLPHCRLSGGCTCPLELHILTLLQELLYRTLLLLLLLLSKLLILLLELRSQQTNQVVTSIALDGLVGLVMTTGIEHRACVV